MERTEQTLDRIGQNIGLFVGRTGRRFQQAGASLRERLSRQMQSPPAPEEQQAPPAAGAPGPESTTSPTMVRAEKWVNRLGDRYRQVTAQAGFQVLHLTARIREEAEDIWAEVQTVRGTNKPQAPQ